MAETTLTDTDTTTSAPTARIGRFGPYGGQYVPETIMPALEELDRDFRAVIVDAEFQAELGRLLADYVGRPTPIYEARGFAARIGSGPVWLKREDLAHTGAHKINNALGQGLLAKRMGKRRIIAETGAGQHGVATATVCAMLGLECVVYMGEEDIRRQALNVYRMRLLGAEVRPVTSGTRTLKDAISEAFRDWVTTIQDSYYLIGSAVGPHPYPEIVKRFQSVISTEARAQIIERLGGLPQRVVACVGGGSNAIGSFAAFVDDRDVEIVGVEAGGRGSGLGDNAATLQTGAPGVLHGAYSYVLQDADGQIVGTHSISAGLDYPGVGPEHSFLKDAGRVRYDAIGDRDALDAFFLLSQTEGILPALEPAHALAWVAQNPIPGVTLVTLSGRGDKDVHTVAEAMGQEGALR
ncbi:MAG: tryptophan synthase subunit beta [Chloroflexi bacterium]|nr:tryptophan synthase subunit beta [Chloroflexota bacterium]